MDKEWFLIIWKLRVKYKMSPVQFSNPWAVFKVSMLSGGLCVFLVCWDVVQISVFSSVRWKSCLFEPLSVLARIYSVWLCLHVHAYSCVSVHVRVNVWVNLLLPPPHPRLIAFLKSSWFAQSLRLEPHTQQMFHWKGHECLIICVIDAAFLFVSKCERLLGSYVSISACYASICTFVCGKGRDLSEFPNISVFCCCWVGKRSSFYLTCPAMNE